MNGKKIFEGVLKETSPNKIISKDGEVKELDNVFLTFSLIYNDIKNILLFHRLIRECVETPTESEITYHRAEYNGAYTYINRLLFNIATELLVFIEEKAEIIGTPQFQLLLKKVPGEARDGWNELVRIATQKDGRKGDPLFQVLHEIRNNTISHYNYRTNELSENFKKFFYTRPKDNANESAYFALGENMSNSRFFYADASIQKYVESITEKYKLELKKDGDQIILDIVTKINISLMNILKIYLKSKDAIK